MKRDPELNTAQAMTYQECEAVKRFASDGEELPELVLLIAHWHRQRMQVPFSLYAANWVAAREKALPALRRAYPLQGKRMIGNKMSDWDSATPTNTHPAYAGDALL